MDRWQDDAQLHAYLVGNGISPEEIGQMQRQDQVRLAQSFWESEMVGNGLEFPAAPMEAPVEVMTAVDIQEPESTRIPEPGAATEVERAAEEPTYSDEQQEKIASFVAVANIDVAMAAPLLAAMDWNLDNAIGMYLETGPAGMGSVGGTGGPSPAVATMSSSTATDSSDLPPPLTELGVNGQAMGMPPASPTPHRGYPGIGSNSNIVRAANGGRNGLGDAAASAAPPRVEQFDEFGIRVPDRVMNERLMDEMPTAHRRRARGGSMGEEPADDPLARAEAEDVVWTGLPPPSHLSHPCGWDMTRNYAKSEKKWILANIQLHTNFRSHQLNNHTWCDETVVSLLRSHFVFWQRGSTCQDAKSFMEMYNLTEDALPWVGIVDARTGAVSLTMRGFVEPSILAMTLLEFIDSNDPSGSQAPRIRHIDFTKQEESGGAADGSAQDDPEDHFNVLYDSDSEGSSNPASPSRGSRAAPAPAAAPAPTSSPSATTSTSTSTAAPAPAARPDYGEVPAEAVDGVKVSIKLPTGKRLLRRCSPTDAVRTLFAAALKECAADADGAATVQDIDLFQAFPRADLRDALDSTIETSGLAGSQIIVSWRADDD